MGGWVTCQKKGPLTTVYFLLPVTVGHCGPNGKRACFFPVIFRSFESLPVVTDGRTDALKGYQLSPSSRWRDVHLYDDKR
jgi:hypothetical protein